MKWHDDSGNWFRSYGNENWEFADNGLMEQRLASNNDLSIRSGTEIPLGSFGGPARLIIPAFRI